MSWQLLVLSLPTENATARMRAWRALKASGAAVLRDGVYLMPAADGHAQSLQAVADDVRGNGGEAQVFEAEPHDGADYGALFDRGTEFGALLAEIGTCRAGLSEDTAQQALKQARKLRKAFEQLVAIDFFPGEAQAQTAAALQALEADAASATAPDEPRAAARAIQRLDVGAVPRSRMGDAAAAVGRSAGQRLADPPLHRPAGAFRVAQVAGRLPQARDRLRLRRCHLHARRRDGHVRDLAGELRSANACAAAPGRAGARARCRRRDPARSRRRRARARRHARRDHRRRPARCSPPPACSKGCWWRSRKRSPHEHEHGRGSRHRGRWPACSGEFLGRVSLLAQARLHQLRRAGRADRDHARRAGGAPALDQRAPLPARAQLLHAAARPRGAAARHLHRLADAPHLGRHRRRRRCSCCRRCSS